MDQPWFVTERAINKALLVWSEFPVFVETSTRPDEKFDQLITIDKDGPHEIGIGIEVKGTLDISSFITKSSFLRKSLRDSLIRLVSSAECPVGLLVVDVKSLDTYFGWILLPRISGQGVKELVFPEQIAMEKVTKQVLEDKLNEVLSWHMGVVRPQTNDYTSSEIDINPPESQQKVSNEQVNLLNSDTHLAFEDATPCLILPHPEKTIIIVDENDISRDDVGNLNLHLPADIFLEDKRSIALLISLLGGVVYIDISEMKDLSGKQEIVSNFLINIALIVEFDLYKRMGQVLRSQSYFIESGRVCILVQEPIGTFRNPQKILHSEVAPVRVQKLDYRYKTL